MSPLKERKGRSPFSPLKGILKNKQESIKSVDVIMKGIVNDITPLIEGDINATPESNKLALKTLDSLSKLEKVDSELEFTEEQRDEFVKNIFADIKTTPID